MYPHIHKGDGKGDDGIIGGSVASGVCVVLLSAVAIILLLYILKRRRFSTRRLAITSNDVSDIDDDQSITLQEGCN